MRISELAFLIGTVLLQFAAECQNATVAPLPAPTSLEQALRSHGISDLSQQSLAAELQNRDPQVRILAANKLAENRDTGAITAIEEALSHEQSIDAQIGLSEALLTLNDRKGLAHLHSMCDDSSIRLQSMISVVRALRLIRSSASECAGTFIALMDQTKDSGELGMAASLLPFLYVDSKTEEAQRIVEKLRTLLLDRKQQTIVRIMCGNALAKIDSPGSAAAIREAIMNEQDPNTKLALESALGTMEKKRR